MMISNKIGSVAEYLASVNELDKSYLASPTANKFIYRGMCKASSHSNSPLLFWWILPLNHIP